MKKTIIFGISAAAVVLFSSSQAFEKMKPQETKPVAGMLLEKGLIPSEADMSSALKEALQVGATNAANNLHKPGGFLNDPLVKIPFPPEAQNVANKLRQVGLGPQVDKFIESMNRGAEDAAIKAAPIFIDAIKGMNLNDAKNILLGPDNAATTYFRNKTSNALFAAFSPELKASLDKIGATKNWTEITTAYNRIPFHKPVQTDIVKYATDKALDGLFLKLADQEKNIRQSMVNPSQVSGNLKKVFQWAAGMKL